MSSGSRVFLREVTDADVEVFFGHQAEPGASEMAAFPARDRAAHLAHWNKQRALASTVLRTIEKAGRVVGNIGSWVHGDDREVGYWIGRDYWGNGIATEALAQFTGLVTDRPLYAHVAAGNIGSRRVLSKCGFRETGVVVRDAGVQLVQYALESP